MPANQALIVALFATGKTLLTTLGTDVTTTQADAQAFEAIRVQLAAAGGNAAAEFLRKEANQLPQGWQPYVLAPGGAIRLVIFAPEPTSPRDLSLLGDRRTIGAFDPSLT